MITRESRDVAVAWVKPNPHNARVRRKTQAKKLGRVIQDITFTAPIVVDENGVLIAGHGRLEAVQQLGWTTIPAVILTGASEAQKRALMLFDNKVPEDSSFDREKLAIELPVLEIMLREVGLDLSYTGFTIGEAESISLDFEENSSDPADEIDANIAERSKVSRSGDLWLLGKHRLLCGDARSEADVGRLMGADRAAMSFLDVPYNLPVSSIGGRGRVQHPEFAMASGEMSPLEFVAFLKVTLGQAASVSCGGALAYVCIDWRSVAEMITAGREVFDAMLNLVVWVKTNAGQGPFYRSGHELIGVFRVGDGPHLNNVEQGRHGRNRSNCWTYPGVNTFRSGRMDELSSHPTPKPVGLVADAMKDCTRRGDVVLDTFSGSGTTIMAAERVGRRGFALDIEPRYVDVAVRRWEAFTGRDATQGETGQTFAEVAAKRGVDQDARRPARTAKRRRV